METAGKNPTSAWIIAAGVILYCAVAAVIAYLMYTLPFQASPWTTLDASRFHDMARMILAGFQPYVSYIDPKPPLLFFTVSAMDMLAPAGSIDTAVMTVINLACAFLVWKIGWEDYGCLAGYTAGLLFLVMAVFAEGYFLFSEQFAVLFILCAFIMARQDRYGYAGLLLGLATGFKQYALLAAIPLLYMMRAGEDRRYHRLLLPIVLVTAAMYLALFAFYGPDVGMSSVYYTWLVAPHYITGNVTTFATYVPGSPLSFAANLIASIVVVLPVLLFAAASFAHLGLRDRNERAIGLFIACFLATLLIRQYLHYWILLLPFLSLLACRVFGERRPPGDPAGPARP